MEQDTKTKEIAAELQHGYQAGGGMGAVEALSKHLADKIVVWHKPWVPVDGTWTGKNVEKARRNEVESFSKAMPDYHEVGNIAVEGNDIVHDMVITGTFKGKPVNFTLPCRWTVENGKITRMGSYFRRDTTYWVSKFMFSNWLSRKFSKSK